MYDFISFMLDCIEWIKYLCFKEFLGLKSIHGERHSPRSVILSFRITALAVISFLFDFRCFMMCDSSVYSGWRTGSDVAISSSGTRKEVGRNSRFMQQPSKFSIKVSPMQV